MSLYSKITTICKMSALFVKEVPALLHVIGGCARYVIRDIKDPVANRKPKEPIIGTPDPASSKLNHLIHDLAIPCDDDGSRFTRTERPDKIRALLASSNYVLHLESPLSMLWTHRDFDPNGPRILVSSHRMF